MRLLLDENIGHRQLVALLRVAGNDVTTVVEALGIGAVDASVAASAIRDGRTLLTADCGDFRSLYAELTAHPGLLLVYAHRGGARTVGAIAAAIGNVAATYPRLDNLILALNDFCW